MQKHDEEKGLCPAIEVRNLSFAYGRNRVLNRVSLSVKEGSITTILGANGCGKSTLFYLMTKNLYPDSGEIYLRGEDVRSLGLKDFAKRAAIVQQSNTSSDDIRVEQLVALGRTPYRKRFAVQSQKDEELIEWAMEATGILEYRDREVGRLSGGQRQRVWIAMALAQETDILFLDEPTTYLDIRYQIEILELVRKLNREYKITIVMVLHDINQALFFSDCIIGLKDGEVKLCGVPDEVITEEGIYELYGISLDVVDIEGQKFVLNKR